MCVWALAHSVWGPQEPTVLHPDEQHQSDGCGGVIQWLSVCGVSASGNGAWGMARIHMNPKKKKNRIL